MSTRPGAFRALYGEGMAYPERLREYPPLVGVDLETARDACVEQCRRALELCRQCGVPVPEKRDELRRIL